MQELNLQLPEDLYDELTAKAKSTRRPLEEVVLQSLRVGMPPSLAHVPERFRADLEVLDQLDDEALRRIGRVDLDEEQAAAYQSLLEKNQDGALNKDEQQQLDKLREEADLLMYRRAYAFALLKWRGNRLPQLTELNRE